VIIDVALDGFDTSFLQGLGGWRSGVPSQTTDFEILGEDRVIEDKVNDRAALLTCCGKDNKKFAHGEGIVRMRLQTC